MKVLLFSAITFLGYLSCYGCCIWTIIEFIIYLAKDKPFNWNSLWFTIASILFTIFMFFASAIFMAGKGRKAYSRRTNRSR